MKHASAFFAFAAALFASGCSAYRGIAETSLVSVRRTPIVIAAPSNAVPVSAEAIRAEERAEQTLAPAFSGPVVIYVEKAVILNGGGSAASNTVSPALSIPLTP